MKKWGLGLLGLTLTSVVAIASANAADMYVPGPGGYKDGPVYVANTWAGFYVGINGGYGVEANSKNITYTAPVTGFVGTSDGFDTRGGFGGGQIGYNWQSGHLVFGIEADIQGSGLKDQFNVTVASNGGPLGVNARQELDFFGTVRGRLGFAFDRTLIYATGGLAYGGVNDHILLANGGATALLSKDVTETGFAIGGGLERYFSSAWSGKFEYQFIDLGREHLSGTSTNGVFLKSSGIDETFHTFRIGLNYHIGPSYEPLK
jgi:outer membrane immunogenic protein